MSSTYGIVETIGEAATLEQLAEECAELGKAALKLSRILRKENPTPVGMAEAMSNLAEEIADVNLCVAVVSDYLELDTMLLEWQKCRRWKRRIEDAATRARQCE